MQWLISCFDFTCGRRMFHGVWTSVAVAERVLPGEFMDELAHAARKDPYHYRRALLDSNTDFPRAKAWVKVLDTAAEKSGWGKKLPREPHGNRHRDGRRRAQRDHHLHGGFHRIVQQEGGRSGGTVGCSYGHGLSW